MKTNNIYPGPHDLVRQVVAKELQIFFCSWLLNLSLCKQNKLFSSKITMCQSDLVTSNNWMYVAHVVLWDVHTSNRSLLHVSLLIKTVSYLLLLLLHNTLLSLLLEWRYSPTGRSSTWNMCADVLAGFKFRVGFLPSDESEIPLILNVCRVLRTLNLQLRWLQRPTYVNVAKWRWVSISLSTSHKVLQTHYICDNHSELVNNLNFCITTAWVWCKPMWGKNS